MKKALASLFGVLVIFAIYLTAQDDFKGIKDSGVPWSEREVYTRDGQKVIQYGRSYALLIGVWDYTAGWSKLDMRCSEKEIGQLKQNLNKHGIDIEKVLSPNRINLEVEIAVLEKILKKHGFEVIKMLNPTSEQMRDEIDNFKKEYGFEESNRLLFLFSGHGHNMDNYTRGLLVPADAPKPERNKKEFLKKAIDVEELKLLARVMSAKHVLFLFDSCFSGTIFQTRDDPVPQYIHIDMKYPVRQFITAGTKTERVPVRSLFMSAIFRGILEGKADTYRDGYITGKELFLFIKNEVTKQTDQQKPQYGTIKKPYDDYEGDFVFVLGDITKHKLSLMQEEFNEVKKMSSNLASQEEDLIIRWTNFLTKFSEDIPGKVDNSLRKMAGVEISKLKQRIKDYNYYYSLAKKEYESGNYNTALKYIEDAEKIRVTEELDLLKRLIGKDIDSSSDRDPNHPPAEYSGKARKNNKEYWEDEVHGHTMVYIPELKIFVDKYEVSYYQFERHFKKHRKKSNTKLIRQLSENHPAIVTYQEALEYCRRNGMRLLTDEEWQWVAGGQKGNIYSWSNEEVDSGGIYRANFKSFKDGNELVAPVKSYETHASPYGLVNLSGNVWEWVQGKICKGGGFLSPEEDLEISKSAAGKYFVGFRCVKDVGK